MFSPELWRGGYRATHFRCQIEKGDNMADYEHVTQDIREELSRIAANKGDKSVEIIMDEILTRLCLRPTMHADCAARAFPAKENRAI